MSLTCLFRTDTTYYFCAVVNCLLGMEGSLFSGESLVEDFGFLVDTKVAEGVGVGFCSRGSREGACLMGENTDGETCCCW